MLSRHFVEKLRDSREVSADGVHPHIRKKRTCRPPLPYFAGRRAIWRNPSRLHHHAKVEAQEYSTLLGRRIKKKKEKEKKKFTSWQKMPVCSFGSTLHNPAGTSFGTSYHWVKHTTGLLASVTLFKLYNKLAKEKKSILPSSRQASGQSAGPCASSKLLLWNS